MPTTLSDTEKRKIIAERNQLKEQDYLSYLEYERDMEARRDEITDMTERLTMPMETTFEFELRDDKLYSEFGTALDDVVYDGYEDIKQKALRRPDFAFEVKRRELDTEEIEEVKTLEEGEMLVTFLPIPDDVREGKTTIDGYNRKRQKMLGRITKRGTGARRNKFTITSFSLDGSNYKAMQASANAIDCDIPDGLSSEEVVAYRHRVGASEGLDTNDVAEKIRSGYDSELARQRGGRWYAGIDAQELEGSYAKAYDFVLGQSDLIDQHMAFLKDLESRMDGGSELRQAQEDARYNLAAALDDRRKGRAVTSIVDSGAQAREAGRNYDGDCPTGSNSAASTETQANSLGFKTKEFVTNCPLCGEKNVKATMAGGLISCGSCGDSVDVCTGEIIKGRKSKKIQKQLGRDAVQHASRPPAPRMSKAEMIQAKYGSAVTKHSEIIVGGKNEYFIHKQTGQRIDI